MSHDYKSNLYGGAASGPYVLVVDFHPVTKTYSKFDLTACIRSTKVLASLLPQHESTSPDSCVHPERDSVVAEERSSQGSLRFWTGLVVGGEHSSSGVDYEGIK
jgi:hypothetical protein